MGGEYQYILLHQSDVNAMERWRHALGSLSILLQVMTRAAFPSPVVDRVVFVQSAPCSILILHAAYFFPGRAEYLQAILSTL
jgi:hypothetical protein